MPSVLRRLLPAASFLLVASAATLSPGRKYTTVERLETSHLEATHQARLRFAKERRSLPPAGPYHDYRAVIHVHAEDSNHTRGTRAEVLQAAKPVGIQVVMFTDHRGPKPDTWQGLRDGVLFIAGSEDDHLLRFPKPGAELRFLSHLEETPDAKGDGVDGMEIYNRHTDAKDEAEFDDYFRRALKDPVEWAKLVAKQAKYPHEIFGAGTDYWPSIMTMWDSELARHPFPGIAANDSHRNQIYNGTLFDPYEVSFLSVTTHILARELTDESIRDSLRNGHVYVAHDWLCDPTGFRLTARTNSAEYEIGDQVPLSGDARLVATLPLPAKLKLIHNGKVVASAEGSVLTFGPKEAGAYRLEAWLAVDGEERPWIYSSPIYLMNLNSPTDPGASMYLVARGYALAGENDKALEWTRKLVDLNQGFDPSVSRSLSRLATYPEFQELVRRARAANPPIVHSQAAFTIPDKEVIPEGLAYDPLTHNFYLSSEYKRKILEISSDGRVRDFIASGQDGIGGVGGMKVDSRTRTLWANAEAPNWTGVCHYDLRTGKLIEKYEMKGDYLFNDLVVTLSGDVYITDSTGGALYWISHETDTLAEFTPGVRFQDANGIALSDDEKKLYVSALPDGLSLVDIRSRKVTPLSRPAGITLIAIDGLYFHKGSLIAIQNGAVVNRVVRLSLNTGLDRIEKMEVLDRAHPLYNDPTTGAIAGDDFYYIANSQVDSLIDGKLVNPETLRPVVILKLPLSASH